MAIVVAAAGLLLALSIGLLSQWNQRRDKATASAWLASAQQALSAYVIDHHRAPCVDANGDGFEDRDEATGNCTSMTSTGGFPYASLALTLPPMRTGQQVRYGVWRGTSSDLTQRALASVTDEVQDVTGSQDFLKRSAAAARAAHAADQPLVAGSDAQGPRSTCQASDVQPAMVVSVQASPVANGSCFVQTPDAELVAIGRFELLGILYTARTP